MNLRKYKIFPSSSAFDLLISLDAMQDNESSTFGLSFTCPGVKRLTSYFTVWRRGTKAKENSLVYRVRKAFIVKLILVKYNKKMTKILPIRRRTIYVVRHKVSCIFLAFVISNFLPVYSTERFPLLATLVEIYR